MSGSSGATAIEQGCLTVQVWLHSPRAGAMTNDFAIVETFEITGRGAVAVLDKTTGRDVGRALRVQVIKPSGETVSTEAFKEWLLRRQPEPHEKEAFMLKGFRKDDLPAGILLRFLDW